MRGRSRIQPAEPPPPPARSPLALAACVGVAVVAGLVAVQAMRPGEAVAPAPVAPVAYAPTIVPPSRTMPAALTSPSVAPDALSPPGAQSAFLSVVEQTRKGFGKGDNDLRKGAERMRRASALCSVLPNKSVRDWVGVVSKLSSNGDGKGVIGVQVGAGVTLRTWEDAWSDAGFNTLVTAASPVHAAALLLTVGDKVRISGSFFEHEADCVYEASWTQRGSMHAPDFVFRFDALAKIP